MESMRKDSHFALVLSVFQEELCLVKKPVAGTVWGRGGLVNSWGFIEWERDPCKKTTVDTTAVLVCGSFGVKSCPERWAQSHNAPVISAFPG